VKTQTKIFHLGDVLSVITGRLVSPRGMEGIYDILNFLSSEELFTRQLPRAARECKPFLLDQYPQFGTPEIDEAINILDRRLEGVKDENRKQVVLEWLKEQVEKYGEMFEVKQPPHKLNEEAKDPIEELIETVGDPNRVYFVVIDKKDK
jgi:hypothetical protein